ncbi:uncharacterized protein LOC144747556 [Ciona intestinalis]
MKTIGPAIIFVLTVFFFRAGVGINTNLLRSILVNQVSVGCSAVCSDTNSACATWKMYQPTMCSGTLRLMCQRTCGVCTRCGETSAEARASMGITSATTCDINCRNQLGETYCDAIYARNMCTGGNRAGCMKSCKVCAGCNLPPAKPPCRNDCADYNRDCQYWNQMGYCMGEGQYPHTRIACPLSCMVCQKCGGGQGGAQGNSTAAGGQQGAGGGQGQPGGNTVQAQLTEQRSAARSGLGQQYTSFSEG